MESRTQGSRPRTQNNPRPRSRTALPRTDPLGAKERNARGQGPRTQAQVFLKKRSSKIFFRRSPKEKNKKGLRKFFGRFLALSNEILTIQKRVLSSSREQGNFRGLEASRPRPRISKRVLEISTSANDASQCDRLTHLFCTTYE